QEALAQADPFAPAAQDTRARRVERADPHRGRALAEQLDQALLHLARGLVGERDREDLPRRHAALDEVRDAMHEHARLAGARAGEPEQRSLAVGDRLLLLVVERAAHFDASSTAPENATRLAGASLLVSPPSWWSART